MLRPRSAGSLGDRSLNRAERDPTCAPRSRAVVGRSPARLPAGDAGGYPHVAMPPLWVHRPPPTPTRGGGGERLVRTPPGSSLRGPAPQDSQTLNRARRAPTRGSGPRTLRGQTPQRSGTRQGAEARRPQSCLKTREARF